MEQVKSNLTEIFDEIPFNFQVSADIGYSTDANTEYLEENGLDGYISSRKLARETKKYDTSDKFFGKDNFTYNNEIQTYVCPLGQQLCRISEYTYDDKPRLAIGQKNVNTANASILRKRKQIQNNSRLLKSFQN